MLISLYNIHYWMSYVIICIINKLIQIMNVYLSKLNIFTNFFFTIVVITFF